MFEDSLPTGCMYLIHIRVNDFRLGRFVTRVGTVLPFSVFFGFRVFALFIRVLGRVFGPDLLRVKSLYQLPGKNQGSLDYTYYITIAITYMGHKAKVMNIFRWMRNLIKRLVLYSMAIVWVC